jgi:ABC-2 type transport system permease protein
VFGSSIHVPGGNYRAYLMSGLFAQSTLFSSAAVSVAVATDMSEGMIDRFKVLPITRSSVLIGRTVSTVIVGLPSTAVMITCALVVGWRAENGLGNAVAGFALLALFGFAMGWVGSVIGLYAKSPQSADVLSMTPTFLLGFVSNVFVNTGQHADLVARVRELEPHVRGGRRGPQPVRHHPGSAGTIGLVPSASSGHDPGHECRPARCDGAARRAPVQPGGPVTGTRSARP